MITHFASVNLYVRDLQELFGFYNEKLGIPCPFKGYGQLDGARVGFPDRPSTVTIWSAERWSEYPPVTLTFLCDDIRTTYEQLRAKGVELAPPEKMVWGGYELRFNDPVGNAITIIEESAE